ncbi:MAG: hypothetical protein NT062_08010 [Proteobacteria bacterium]|nr:hypothetical protein [Pseudomonadota bacterium]
MIPMPPSRRPAAPCTRCSGRKFMRVIPREHSAAREGIGQVSAPMYATFKPRMRHLNGATWTLPLEIELAGMGLLEMYICKKCGFVEWYCVDVERIPAHPALMTEDIDYEADVPPYR